MNKHAMGLVMVLCIMPCRFVYAEGVDLLFSGTLVDKQCVFEQGETPLEVVMPSRAIKYFIKYKRTEPTTFDLVFKNCTSATQDKLVTITFTGAQTQMVDGINMLTPSGNTGLVIGLEDAAGNPVSVGTSFSMGKVVNTGNGSENRFRFGAYALAPDVNAVTAGAFSATTTFEIAFQ